MVHPTVGRSDLDGEGFCSKPTRPGAVPRPRPARSAGRHSTDAPDLATAVGAPAGRPVLGAQSPVSSTRSATTPSGSPCSGSCVRPVVVGGGRATVRRRVPPRRAVHPRAERPRTAPPRRRPRRPPCPSARPTPHGAHRGPRRPSMASRNERAAATISRGRSLEVLDPLGAGIWSMSPSRRRSSGGSRPILVRRTGPWRAVGDGGRGHLAPGATRQRQRPPLGPEGDDELVTAARDTSTSERSTNGSLIESS